MNESTNNRLYQAMTRITHRDLKPIVDEFSALLIENPSFVSRALVYIATNSKINDQRMAAIVTLLQASPEYPEFREAGRALALGSRVYDIEFEKNLPGLEAFRLIRIMDFIRSSDKPVTRLARKIVIDWLTSLDETTMDAVSILNRKSLVWLIRYYRAPHAPYLNDLLFTDTPPAGSKIAALKLIAAESNPIKKAELVMEYKIPYRIALSVLPKVDAAIGVALLSRMTPQEALNSRNWIETSGLLEIPEVKAAYLKLIEKATKSVSTLEKRKSVKGTDADVNAAIESAANKAARQVRIENPPVIFGDQSGSQEQSIETTREIIPIVVAASVGDVHVYTYNTSATLMKFNASSLSDVRREFSKLRATGGTSFHVALRAAQKKGLDLTNIIWIGDLNESSAFEIKKALVECGVQNMSIIQLRCGTNLVASQTIFPNDIEALGIRVVHYDLTQQVFDPYIGDQIVGWFAGDKTRNLADLISEIELPKIKIPTV